MPFIEIISATLGVLSSLLLATRHRLAPWAWPIWLLSNAGWIAFGALGGHWFLVAQNAVFAVTSGIGCWRWLVRPRQAATGAIEQRFSVWQRSRDFVVKEIFGVPPHQTPAVQSELQAWATKPLIDPASAPRQRESTALNAPGCTSCPKKRSQ